MRTATRRHPPSPPAKEGVAQRPGAPGRPPPSPHAKEGPAECHRATGRHHPSPFVKEGLAPCPGAPEGLPHLPLQRRGWHSAVGRQGGSPIPSCEGGAGGIIFLLIP